MNSDVLNPKTQNKSPKLDRGRYYNPIMSYLEQILDLWSKLTSQRENNQLVRAERSVSEDLSSVARSNLLNYFANCKISSLSEVKSKTYFMSKS